MVALVTGASSGIGRDIAKELSKRGYDIIGVSRDEEKLKSIENELATKYYPIPCDLTKKDECIDLHEKVLEIAGDGLEVVINCAGFGNFGAFTKTSLEKEIAMIETNITAVHILMKLFLQDMQKRDKGYILNVSSISAFMQGPLMATYYATKSYVVKLTRSSTRRIKKTKFSCLCRYALPRTSKYKF